MSLADAVEGFLDEAEVRLLSDYGAQAKLCIVEIGSYRGRSTIALAERAVVPVFAIDPHEPFTGGGFAFDNLDRAHFMRNLLNVGLAERVHLVNLPSTHAAHGWSRPIDVLWIDGDHREAAVCADVQAWLPHVVVGGVVLLHDIYEPGVQAALQDIEATGDYVRIPSAVPIAQYQRVTWSVSAY